MNPPCSPRRHRSPPARPSRGPTTVAPTFATLFGLFIEAISATFTARGYALHRRLLGWGQRYSHGEHSHGMVIEPETGGDPAG